MSYTVTFKKTFTVIGQDDEATALDDAAHKLALELINRMCPLDDFFETSVQKEPVKEITITEDGIKQFLEDNFEGEELTEQQIKDCIDFLETDVSEWLKTNLRCFLKESD